MARKPSKIAPRNPFVIPAKHRQAGSMDDRREPRGGARNEEREWLDEWTRANRQPDDAGPAPSGSEAGES